MYLFTILQNIGMKIKRWFNLQEKRDYEDYIYSYESLSTLKGRHYAKKKNRVANFRKNYEYSYESISKDNIGEVIAFQEKWYKLHSEFGGEITKKWKWRNNATFKKIMIV